MRKPIYLLIIIVALLPDYGISQNKFKIEFVGQGNGQCSRDSYGVFLDETINNQSYLGPSADQIFWKSNDEGEYSIIVDEVLQTDHDFLYVRKYSNGGSGQNQNCGYSPAYASTAIGCITTFGGTLPDIDVEHFNVFRIEPLANLNVFTDIGMCESQTVRVSNNNCSAYYSLSIFVDNGGEQEILAYGKHANPYIFEPENYNNVTNTSTVKFKVYYNENKSVFSDILTLDIVPCIPVLDPNVQNNIQGLDVTCRGGSDGGVTLVFDRPLTDEEYMQLVFKQNGVEVHSPDYNFYDSDFQGNTLTYRGDDLAAGEYELEWNVGVNNGLIPGGPEFVSISEPSPISYTLQKTDVSCEGGSDGELEVLNLSGGSGNYTVHWFQGGAPFAPPQGSTATHLVNLQEGSYSVVVEDGNGCFSGEQELGIQAVKSSPQLNSYLLFQAGESPNFLPTGSIVLQQISGGDGNYVFDWTKDNQSFVPNDPENLTGLEPGTYTVVITDDGGQGCASEPYHFTIHELEPLEIFISETVSITCEGDVGTLMANALGGTNGGYQYLWSTGETTESINVGQGSYSITVTDNANTMEEAFYEFEYVNPLLTVEVIQNNSLCKGEDFGSIQLNISGGTGGPYDVSWLDSPSNETFRENLPVGEYVYIVSDGECVVSNEDNPITLTEPSLKLAVEPVFVSNTSINGASDGALEIVVINGVAPFSYQWTKNNNPFIPPMGSTDTELTHLGAGKYQVLITDANGCSTTFEEPIVIIEPEPLEIVELIPTHISCRGGATGSITANVTGIPLFTYVWEKQGQVTFNAPNAATITGLTAGTYTLRLSDDSIVPEMVQTIILTEPAQELSANVAPFPMECFIGEEGTINITAFGGTPPYVYSMDDGLTFQGSSTFSNLNVGEYSVIIQDSGGCQIVETVTVGLPNQIQAELALASQAFVNESVFAVDLSYPIPDEVAWTVPEGALVLARNNDELELHFTAPGEYEVGITVFKENCWSEQVKKILVLEKDGLIAEGNQSKDNPSSIEEFIVYPNPTSGMFNVDVRLGEVGNIGLRVFGLANNNLILQRQSVGKGHHNIPMNIEGLPSGIYLVILETPFGTALRKLILR